MNEAIVSAALKTLNIGDVSELTDEQITETVERINSLKIYDKAGLDEFKSNIRKDFRTTIEGEAKGKAYEKIEKDILNKFGLELEKGTDYNTALELIEKAKLNWVKESSNDETLTKEMEALREKLKSVNENNESSLVLNFAILELATGFPCSPLPCFASSFLSLTIVGANFPRTLDNVSGE